MVRGCRVVRMRMYAQIATWYLLVFARTPGRLAIWHVGVGHLRGVSGQTAMASAGSMRAR